MSMYAMSDIHGHLELYKMVAAMLEPGDKVFYLGDATDRGPEPWECAKAIYHDPRFIYLMGNHEDMLLRVIGPYSRGTPKQNAVQLLAINGGLPTYQAAILEPDLEDWIKRLRELPNVAYYMNYDGKTFILSHAGFTPYKGKEVNDILWDRNHLYDEWDVDQCEDVYIIHGHTPIPYIEHELKIHKNDGALWYCGGRKCCIDNYTAHTHSCILLNLDTEQSQIIKIE